MNKGPWKFICISKKESKHSFPVEHTDIMMQAISHKVPTDKYDDLAKFDGSVIVDRTQWLLNARCGMEANNMLALNLAHGIITGKKTVAKARKAYGDMVKEKMNGDNPEYMKMSAVEVQDNSMDSSMHKKMSQPNMKDAAMIKDGKMMQMKPGKTMMMKQDMTFPNGNMVMMDGTMKMKEGSSHMLKEGDCVMMDRKMKPMSMKKKMKRPI